jgi:hypothetical protein
MHVVAMLLSSMTGAAHAQPSAADWESCRIELAGPISAAWASALRQACDELAARQDLDQDAHVRIASGPADSLTLQATLRDGRSAVRHVESPAGLALTMAALLVLPTPVVASPVADEITTHTSEITAAAPVPRPATATTDERDADTPAANLQSVDTGFRLHLGLSASVIAHVAGVPNYVAAGFAVRIALRLGIFLVDASPRWEAAQASLRMRLPDFEMHSFGMAAFFGVRVWDGSDGAIETGIGILLLAETQSYREAGSELVGTVISNQPAMFARLLWGNPPSLRWTIGFEVHLAPSRFSHTVYVRDMLPPLPAFGVGLSFGGQWESS